jgi:DNA-directed RNA polymerase specialized sigma24 family protein
VSVVEGLSGGATDTERFADVEEDVRDLVAGLTDTDPDSFSLEFHLEQDGREYTPVVANLREQEERARRAVEQRDESRRVAVTAMRNANLSYRAIAEILGLSHERVAQLAREYRRQVSPSPSPQL